VAPVELADRMARILEQAFPASVARERANNVAGYVPFHVPAEDGSLEDCIASSLRLAREPYAGGVQVDDATVERLAAECAAAAREQ